MNFAAKTGKCVKQIFSALAYYADHQAEIDEAIESDIEFVNSLRQKAKP